MSTDKDWIGEKILANEDLLSDVLRGEESAPDSSSSSFDPNALPEATPVDPAAEKEAFAELRKFFAENPEDDCEVTALSLDEFSATTVPETTEPQE